MICFREVFICGILLVATIQDLTSHRIHNSVILVGTIVSLVFQIIEKGGEGIKDWSLGYLVPIVILYVLFYIRAMGAGDIKLFSIVGGFYGTNFLFKCMILAFFIASIYSIVVLFRYKLFLSRFRYFYNYIKNCYMNRKIGLYCTEKVENYKYTIHFSPYISISAAILLIWICG